MSTTFARLCQLIDQATSDMGNDMKELQKEIQQLEAAANSAKVLRNKSDYLGKELDMFEETYLRMYNWGDISLPKFEVVEFVLAEYS